jgi:hypothetical protein
VCDLVSAARKGRLVEVARRACDRLSSPQPDEGGRHEGTWLGVTGRSVVHCARAGTYDGGAQADGEESGGGPEPDCGTDGSADCAEDCGEAARSHDLENRLAVHRTRTRSALQSRLLDRWSLHGRGDSLLPSRVCAVPRQEVEEAEGQDCPRTTQLHFPRQVTQRSVLLRHRLGPRRQAEGYVFTVAGKPYTDWKQREALEDAFEAAELPQDGLWHGLRHTYASILENAGISRALIEILLGHSARGVTALYTHPFKDAYGAVEDALISVFGVNGASTDGSVTTGNDETPPRRRFGQNADVERDSAEAAVSREAA